jgi:hypothetical protein
MPYWRWLPLFIFCARFINMEQWFLRRHHTPIYRTS